MADLRSWLRENVGTEARRDEVRAVVESLDDLRWLCDDMLSEHLNLEAWAPVARERFLAAWRELKGGGAAARRRSSPPPGPAPSTWKSSAAVVVVVAVVVVPSTWTSSSPHIAA